MGNMKYVKLFESWLATNDSRYIWEAEEVDRFSKENPEDWPIEETKIKDLYSDPGGKLNLDVLGSIIGRVYSAKTGGTWSDEIKNSVIQLETASVGYKDAEWMGGQRAQGAGLPDSYARAGATAIGGNFKPEPIYSKSTQAGDFIQLMYDVIGKTYSTKRMIYSPSEEKRGNSYEGAISDEWTKNMVAVKGKDDPDGKKYGVIIVGTTAQWAYSKPDDPAINLLILCISAKGNLFATTLGAYLLYLATGKSKDMEDSRNDTAIANMTDDLLNSILAGETKGSVNYASTDIGGVPFDPSSGKPGAYSITSAATTYLGQLEFEFNKSELNEKATGTLSSKKLQADMTNPKYKSIVIAGYADGMGGKSQRNDTLSSERAENVLEFIKKMPWFSKVKAKVSFEGRSISNPIIPDNGGKDKLAASYNRRVEIIFDGAKPNYDKIKASYEKVKASGGSKK